MISILVYPNLTFQKDLSKDSYVIVMTEILRELSEVRDDLEWSILTTERVATFEEFPNVRQLGMTMPTYPNAMRTHFNHTQIRDQIGWKEHSYDLVFSHLPEQTLALRNLFYNRTNERPEFVGYTHWTEFDVITGYPESMIGQNFLGLLAMSSCGVNTEAQRQMILTEAEYVLADDRVRDLADVLQVLTLGAETPDYTPTPEHSPKTIAFNHRPHAYKSYDFVLAQLDQLWEERQDFQLWVPLADGSDRPYVDTTGFDRHGYLSHLSGCRFGVGAAQKYAGWAISVTDGYGVGLPYLLHNEPSYRELAGEAGRYFEPAMFLDGCRRFLDDDEFRETAAAAISDRFEDLRWENRIGAFSAMIDKAVGQIVPIGDRSQKYHEIRAQIDASSGPVTKLALTKARGWGIGIPWTSYRERLRQDGYQVTATSYSSPE